MSATMVCAQDAQIDEPIAVASVPVEAAPAETVQAPPPEPSLPKPIPKEFSPIPEMTVTRGAHSLVSRDKDTGQILIEGNTQVSLGAFRIIDNSEHDFRLVMDTLENPQIIQVQGWMPIMDKLSVRISGEIYPNDGVYVGTCYIKYDRLKLWGFFKRDWAPFQFIYRYKENTFVELFGAVRNVEIGTFPIALSKLRFSNKQLLFNFFLNDDTKNFGLKIQDFPLQYRGYNLRAPYVGDISFLGQSFPATQCRLGERYVSATIRSNLFFGAEQDISMKWYKDGTVAFLKPVQLSKGVRLSMKGICAYAKGYYTGQGEIHYGTLEKKTATVICSRIMIPHTGGPITGTAQLDTGSVPGLAAGRDYAFVVSPQGTVSYTASPAPRST